MTHTFINAAITKKCFVCSGLFDSLSSNYCQISHQVSFLKHWFNIFFHTACFEEYCGSEILKMVDAPRNLNYSECSICMKNINFWEESDVTISRNTIMKLSNFTFFCISCFRDIASEDILKVLRIPINEK